MSVEKARKFKRKEEKGGRQSDLSESAIDFFLEITPDKIRQGIGTSGVARGRLMRKTARAVFLLSTAQGEEDDKQQTLFASVVIVIVPVPPFPLTCYSGHLDLTDSICSGYDG